MSLSVTCPGCNRKLKAPDQAAGKKVKCPKCGEQLTVPGTAQRQKPTPKNGGLPDWITSPEANTASGAGAVFLKGERPLPTTRATVRHVPEYGPDERQQDSKWEAQRDLRPPTHEEALPPPPAGFGRFLLLGACGVAAILLLAVCYWIYTDRAPAQAAADVARQAQEATAKRQAEEERAQREQVAYQQGLERAALKEKQGREEAERRVAQLESQQKQQADQERARQEQLEKKEGERKRAEKSQYLAACRQIGESKEIEEIVNNWSDQVGAPLAKAHDASNQALLIRDFKAETAAETAARAACDAVKPVAKKIISNMEECVLKLQRIAQSYHEAQSPYESLFSAQYKYYNLLLRAMNKKIAYEDAYHDPNDEVETPRLFDELEQLKKACDEAEQECVSQLSSFIRIGKDRFGLPGNAD